MANKKNVITKIDITFRNVCRRNTLSSSSRFNNNTLSVNRNTSDSVSVTSRSLTDVDSDVEENENQLYSKKICNTDDDAHSSQLRSENPEIIDVVFDPKHGCMVSDSTSTFSSRSDERVSTY